MADDCTAPLFRLKLNVGDGYKREDIKKEGNQFFSKFEVLFIHLTFISKYYENICFQDKTFPW